MNVMIDCDRVGNLSAAQFDDTLEFMMKAGHDIRLVCRGHAWRVGDDYDYLREIKDKPFPAHFTEGFHPDAFLVKSEKWFPDMVLYKPVDASSSWLFTPRGSNLDERETEFEVGGETFPSTS